MQGRQGLLSQILAWLGYFREFALGCFRSACSTGDKDAEFGLKRPTRTLLGIQNRFMQTTDRPKGHFGDFILKEKMDSK